MTDFKSMLERRARIAYLERKRNTRREIQEYLNIAREKLASKLAMRAENKEIVMMQLEQNEALREANEAALRRFIEEINELNSECSHELLLCLGKDKPFDNNPIPYSVCLCCGSPLRLENTGSDRVIDVRGKVDVGDIYTIYQGKNILVRDAQEVLARLYSINPDISSLKIKECLMDSFLNRTPVANLEYPSFEESHSRRGL